MTTPTPTPHTNPKNADVAGYHVGALPPYSVTHIDPDHLGIPGPERWFVMGTVGGDPRDQQGPIAVCEWEPSAHTIARLLNATAGGREPEREPYTGAAEDWPPLTAEEVDQLTAWSRSSARGGFRVWLEHDTALTAAAAIVKDRTQLLPAESMALTVGLAQTLRGEAPDGNVAALCVLALARMTGRHDWTADAEGATS